jgi:hypothetical protein
MRTKRDDVRAVLDATAIVLSALAMQAGGAP